MMKNKKVMVVFILAVIMLLVMSCFNFTKADNDDEGIGGLPIIDTNNNPSNNTQTNEPANVPAPVVGNNTTTTNGTSENTLPQTGVAGDTALFVFIGVCIIAAVYAYFRVKKYSVR